MEQIVIEVLYLAPDSAISAEQIKEKEIFEKILFEYFHTINKKKP